MSERRDEIDFLMETEYALTSQLERVQSRLTELLEDAGAFPYLEPQTPSEPPKYRAYGNVLVLRARSDGPDGVA